MALLGLALLAVAPAAQGQRAQRRPTLPAAADSNDAGAYYARGAELLRASPAEAAVLFHWSAQLRPGWADPLYGEYVATLLSDARFLARYMDGDRATRRSARALRADSLYLRALRADPFVQHRFEGDLMRLWVSTLLAGGDPSRVGDQGLLSYYTETVMADMPPVIRARLRAARGQLVEASAAYDEALRERANRRNATRRWLLQERARMYALAGNHERALADMRLALEASVDADEEGLVFLYESKALMEHGVALLHERTGAPDEARDAYGRALAEDLSYHPAHQRLAMLAVARGDTATAMDEMRLAAETGAADPVARLAYGALLATARKLPEAEAELRAATELAPHFAEPWFVLGLVRAWDGRSDAAVEAYRAFLARARRDDPRRAQIEEQLAAVAGAPSP